MKQPRLASHSRRPPGFPLDAPCHNRGRIWEGGLRVASAASHPGTPNPGDMSGQAMIDLSAFHGPNAGYVLDLYERYLQDPSSVDSETRAAFDRLDPAEIEALVAGPRPGAPVATVAPSGPIFDVSTVVGASALTQAIRDYGHLDVQLDPLGTPPHGAPAKPAMPSWIHVVLASM